MASMTKVMATAPSVMHLYEEGRFQLDDPVAKYLPEFAQNGKQAITIRQLLTHSSGLPPDLPLSNPWSGKQTGLDLAFASVPMNPPGTIFRYSDINFIVLGALVEKLSGMPLNQYAEKYIFAPMGMKNTRFLPPAAWKPLIAPTQRDEHGEWLQGTVHDPTSRRMGGVAGHAGLFSDAGDVSIFAQNLLARLQGHPSHFPLKQSTLQLMITPLRVSDGKRMIERGLGWDIDSAFSSPRGDLFPIGSFGHTGFTGTSLWIDPASQTYVVILSNAVHMVPSGHTNMSPLRSGVATLVAKALTSSPQ
jgi:CubicO group peptidase (beta-lactamase class C family)